MEDIWHARGQPTDNVEHWWGGLVRTPSQGLQEKLDQKCPYWRKGFAFKVSQAALQQLVLSVGFPGALMC